MTERKKTANVFRFMPSRIDADGRMLFSSQRHVKPGKKKGKGVVEGEHSFLAGITVGPAKPSSESTIGNGWVMNAGGVIIPAHPNKDAQTVPVRAFTPKGEKHPRRYVDWASFQEFGGTIIALPYFEDNTLYVEVWTGDHMESEGAYQLIQTNMFSHGSVAYAGGSVIVNAVDESQGLADESGMRASQAELIGERKGKLVDGVPLWIARLFRIRFSAEDSETLLVRQMGKFYLFYVKDFVPTYIEVDASVYGPRFERLTIDQNLVPVAA